MCEAQQGEASPQGEQCKPMYPPLALRRVHNQHCISVFLKRLVFLQAEKLIHHLLVIRKL
jgi:hypothetical protein